MKVTELVPITKIIPKEVETWDFLNEFINNSKDFFIYQDETPLSTHIQSLPFSEYIILRGLLAEHEISFHDDKKEDQESHFKRLKIFYQSRYGEKITTYYMDQFIPLNLKVLQKTLVLQNLGKIPNRTHATFLLEENKDSCFSYSLEGSNQNEIRLNQIFVKYKNSQCKAKQEYTQYMDDDRKFWTLKNDYTELNGPEVSIQASNTNAQRILEACIKLNRAKRGCLVSNEEIFTESKVVAYEQKMSKFTKNNPQFKQILIYHKSNHAYEVKLPQNL